MCELRPLFTHNFRSLFMRCLCALTALVASLPALGAEWTTVKGTIVLPEGVPIPARKAIVATKDAEVAAKDKEFLTEDLIVSAKSRGIKNVAVWLAPEPTVAEMASLKNGKVKKFPSFKAADINPDVAKPAKEFVEIDQPCCRFIPHILLAQQGQTLRIKNSAPIAHSVKWDSTENGNISQLLASGGELIVKDLKAEKYPIPLTCALHPWMNAQVRVFDHPYFALTDEDGKFEIKNAPLPVGKTLRLFLALESGYSGGTAGRFGKTIQVKAGTTDLGKIGFEVTK